MTPRKPWITLIALLTAVVLAAGAYAETYTRLRPGDSGSSVRRLQTALNQLGFSAGSVDGRYGAQTERAVRAFQQRYGLTVDGLAGPVTQRRLYELTGGSAQPTAAPSSSSSSSSAGTSGGWFSGQYATMQRASTGVRVQLLQAALHRLGYFSGAIDGRYGTATINAVSAFQRAEGLTRDGKAGQRTLQRIEARLGTANTAQTAASYLGSLLSGAAVQPAATPAPTQAPAASANGRPGRTLRQGDSGDDVRVLQNRLIQLGYLAGPADGSFGMTTRGAVVAFQARAGLTADGVAGSRTYDRLYASNAPAALYIPAGAETPATPAPTPAPTATPAPQTNTTLRSGMSGAAVTQLQTALVNLGYSLSVTGTYDAATVSAVRLFQTRNSLSVDGVAGPRTLGKLYGGGALGPSTAASTTSFTAPSVGQVRLLHWFNDVKPILSNGQILLIYDPATGLSWQLKILSRGRHCDAEPLTAEDTAIMVRAFGNRNTWDQKAVYVRLPNGVWTVGSTHDMPHLSGNISNNNFNGHLCVHFLRDMDECRRNDPNYGVANQQTIRAMWKRMTGEDVP